MCVRIDWQRWGEWGSAGDDAQVNAFMCKLFQIENSHLLYTMTPLPWSFFLFSRLPVLVSLLSFSVRKVLSHRLGSCSHSPTHAHRLETPNKLERNFFVFFFRRRRRTSENPNIGKLVRITYCVRLGNLAFDWMWHGVAYAKANATSKKKRESGE